MKCKECAGPSDGWCALQEHLCALGLLWPQRQRGGQLPQRVTVDEEELIEVLQEYFAGLLKTKKNVIRYVVGEFQRVYKAKDENLNYEKELTPNLPSCKRPARNTWICMLMI